METLFITPGIIETSIISGSTWLNLTELGPAGAMLGIKIFGEKIMEGVDSSYLDLGPALIRGHTFIPISPKGASIIAEKSIFTRSQLTNAENILKYAVNNLDETIVQNPLDDFIVGQLALIGTGASSIIWHP